jgi:hypothetical protein
MSQLQAVREGNILVEQTKILFNHQGSDSELMKQIAIAVQAINTLNDRN